MRVAVDLAVSGTTTEAGIEALELRDVEGCDHAASHRVSSSMTSTFVDPDVPEAGTVVVEVPARDEAGDPVAPATAATVEDALVGDDYDDFEDYDDELDDYDDEDDYDDDFAPVNASDDTTEFEPVQVKGQEELPLEQQINSGRGARSR